MGSSTFLSEYFGCFRIWQFSQKFLGTRIGVRYESQCKSNSCNYQRYRPNSIYFSDFNTALFHSINHCSTHQKGDWKCFVQNTFISMTQLLTHTVAHSTRPSFRPKTNNQPTKMVLSLVVTWVKVVKMCKILTFKVNFLCQKGSESF